MRISATKEDRGFIHYDAIPVGLRKQIKVFLDGAKQSFVITADEEEGTVLRHIKGKDGKFVSIGDEFATETLTGDVRIELPVH